MFKVGVKSADYDGPDESGHFGPYGGIFVGETLIAAVEELAEVYEKLSKDSDFWHEFDQQLKFYVGRPSPLYFAQRITNHCGGAKIYLKREDLNHTGAHKINNTIGQALSLKLVRGSTEWRARLLLRAWVWNATSIWVRRIS